MIDLDELQSVRDRERQTDKLQQLRDSFYADAGDLIGQLRRERDRAADRADDPFDAPEVNRLTDEINTAEQTVEAIFEKRIGKIVKAASFAAADLPAESAGMTTEERALFEALVDDIERTRGRVLDILAGESEPGDGDAGAIADDAGDVSEASDAAGVATAGQDIAEAMGGEAELVAAERGETSAGAAGGEVDDSGGEADTDRVERGGVEEPESPVSDGGAAVEVGHTTVRITDDVGPILGVDEREYDLAADDVVTLPTDNADPLIDRGVAESLE